MDFLRVIRELAAGFEQAQVDYALIGGFAMAMHGVQRATVDLDFLLLLDDLERADGLFESLGYRRYFRSDNVSHYRADDNGLGRIDLLHAFREPARAMLRRAKRLEVSPGLTIPVASLEDIIGLKIQALVNDPSREEQDWMDIRLLLQAAANQKYVPDWLLIEDYLVLFEMGHRLSALRGYYEQAQ